VVPASELLDMVVKNVAVAMKMAMDAVVVMVMVMDMAKVKKAVEMIAVKKMAVEGMAAGLWCHIRPCLHQSGSVVCGM
jgi:hypothetical protein